MELKFSNNIDSAKRLDEIMNSYSGRDQGSIMADEDSLTMILSLLEHGKIVVTEHTYPFDYDIRNDSEIMEVYTELARTTRWRQFEYTEIEGIRINALRQMQQEGMPSYDGDFVCYQEGQFFVHCGNLTLERLLLYLSDHKKAERFYLFTYPYWTEDHTAKYYRFDLSETAIKGAEIYHESVVEEMRKIIQAGDIFPKIPQTKDNLSSPS